MESKSFPSNFDIAGRYAKHREQYDLRYGERGKFICVSPYLEVGQWDGYYHVRNLNGPILINTKGFSHWIVAYGTKTTGSYLWRNYYYAAADNGYQQEPNSYSNPWWYAAPWFIVYVRVFG
mgnify:CR=1 FL=1